MRGEFSFTRSTANLRAPCLLLETDSPVLSPTPGERNEPANARVALRAIAELKEVTETEVAERVHENTVRLFGKSLAGTIRIKPGRR